MLFMTVSL